MVESRERRNLNQQLFKLAKRLIEINKDAEKLGIFTNERKLLECPKCGLTEDIDSNGILFTRFKDFKKVELQFKKVKGRRGRFRCSNCGKILKAVDR